MQSYIKSISALFYSLWICDDKKNSPLPNTSSKPIILIYTIVSVLSATALATPQASALAKEELPVETVLQGKFNCN